MYVVHKYDKRFVFIRINEKADAFCYLFHFILLTVLRRCCCCGFSCFMFWCYFVVFEYLM